MSRGYCRTCDTYWGEHRLDCPEKAKELQQEWQKAKAEIRKKLEVARERAGIKRDTLR